jgi:hypothetical protein
VTFRASAPRKRQRWLVLLAIVVLGTGMIATTTLAAPTFNFVQDEQGANDEPGQKDLSADATAIDPANNDYYTAWKWDDTSWSGNNTGDACSLFDTDADGLANFAVCVTIGKPAVETSTRVYSCGDTRADRCTGSVLEGTEAVDSSANWCTVAPATAAFPPPPQGGDTQATCNITLLESDLGLTGLDNGTFLNSCSYPSEQPNSDPSDCVHQIAITTATISTDSRNAGTIAWQARLADTATMSPSNATGSVTFKLYSDSTCQTLIWTSDADTSAPFASGTTGGSPVDGNLITNLNVNSNATYYWIASFTPSGPFTADDSLCGEATTISASITGSTGN